jgi:hypothetical protein
MVCDWTSRCWTSTTRMGSRTLSLKQGRVCEESPHAAREIPRQHRSSEAQISRRKWRLFARGLQSVRLSPPNLKRHSKQKGVQLFR